MFWPWIYSHSIWKQNTSLPLCCCLVLVMRQFLKILQGTCTLSTSWEQTRLISTTTALIYHTQDFLTAYLRAVLSPQLLRVAVLFVSKQQKGMETTLDLRIKGTRVPHECKIEFLVIRIGSKTNLLDGSAFIVQVYEHLLRLCLK